MRSNAFSAAVALAISVISVAAQSHQVEGQGQVGRVKFMNSCDPKVQPLLETGVAMLHSFWFSAGEKTFRDVLVQDPSCTIANWGIAAILMANPLGGQGASQKSAAAAQEAIDQGRRVSPKTQRERDYIEAVAAYYQDFSTRSERSRQESRAKAFEELAARFPDDDEARIFSALYIAGTQSQSDQTFAAYLKAAAILEKLFVKYPDHPGVAHYLIHSYDAPPIAQQGLPAARRYASIAPAAPHALHMPSHIFTRVGAWKESIESNAASAKAGTDRTFDKWHAYDYMVYAHLQLGQEAAARQIIRDAQTIPTKVDNFPIAYAYGAMPARFALERGAWAEAAKLELTPAPGAFAWTKYPQAEAVNAFARGIGAAATKDAAQARTEAARLLKLRDVATELKIGYWAGQIEIQSEVVRGLATIAEGKTDEGIEILRQAAAREDATEKHVVTPGPLLPAREVLASALLDAGKPADALREYETVLTKEPNRLRATGGAGLAAERSGDKQKARLHYAKVLELTATADSSRPEAVNAKRFLERS